MKCQECGGRLKGAMTFCPYCGVRQDVDLRQIHFRDLGEDQSLPCPNCRSGLSVVEFDTKPEVRIERCAQCYGMFFNPGELEFLIEQKTNPFVWIDLKQMQQISEDFGSRREIRYLKCPMCAERMSHINFGGRSGVILDHCGTHGLWVEGGELRRLIEWWRAGGKHFYEESQREKVRKLQPEEAPRKWKAPSGVETGSSGHTYDTEGRMLLGGYDVADEFVHVICRFLWALIR